jgi:hypothetical protein
MVRLVEPLIAPTAAAIVACPEATVLASPIALMLAILGADELHAAVSVRSCVLPSV